MSEQELQQEENFEQQMADVDQEIETEVEEVQEEQDSAPKGFLSYEEYLEKGGDPDMFRGKKAYSQYYEKDQEARKLQREFKELKNSVSTLTEVFQKESQARLDKQRAEYEKQLQEAKSNFDIDGYEQASKGLAALDQAEVNKQQPKQQQEPDYIREFRAKTPQLDFDSDSFDRDFDQAVTNEFNDRAIRALKMGADEGDLAKILEEVTSKKMAKFYPETVKQPKKPVNTRQGGKNAVKETTITRVSKLDSSARGIYEELMESGNKDAAKLFLDSMIKGDK